MTRATTIVTALAIAGGLSACATVNNDRLSTGDSTIALFAPPDEAAPTLSPATGRSVTQLDRSSWEVQTVVSGVGDVQHNPHYTSLGPAFTDETSRQRGEFPYRGTALDLSADQGAQFLEMVASPFAACLDIALFIPKAIMKPPLVVTTSVGEPFERYDAAHEGTPAPDPQPSTMNPAESTGG